jgi:hypothetical protein
VGNAYYTRRHRFVSTFVYDLPFGRGKKYFGGVSRLANLAVGGWRVTGVTLAQTGPWLTTFFPSSLSDPSGTFPSSRSVSQQVGIASVARLATCLTRPTVSTSMCGNCGVGVLGGPGTAAFSMSAGKTFALTERFGLRFESQFANLFNLLNKAAPNTNVASGSFGQISQSQLVEQAGPRTIQLHLRLQF